MDVTSDELTELGTPLCSQIDPELFFPEKNDSGIKAKRICAVCELAVPCLIVAIKNKESHGIWGGTNYRQRLSIKTMKQVQAFVAQLRKNFGPRSNTNK